MSLQWRFWSVIDVVIVSSVCDLASLWLLQLVAFIMVVLFFSQKSIFSDKGPWLNHCISNKLSADTLHHFNYFLCPFCLCKPFVSIVSPHHMITYSYSDVFFTGSCSLKAPENFYYVYEVFLNSIKYSWPIKQQSAFQKTQLRFKHLKTLNRTCYMNKQLNNSQILCNHLGPWHNLFPAKLCKDKNTNIDISE